MTALALLHREEVIEQVRAGKRLIDIAKGLGLTSHAAISLVLSKDPEYQLAREIGAESRLEQRETELEASQDPLTLARARELLSHARWRAEREFPHRWGQKQEVTVKETIVKLSFGVPSTTIEHEINPDPDPDK